MRVKGEGEGWGWGWGWDGVRVTHRSEEHGAVEAHEVRGARSRATELVVVDVRCGAHLVRVRARVWVGVKVEW